MTRTEVLNLIAATIRAQNYLEIGVRNPRDNFDNIRVKEKVGVDIAPARNGILKMTSDAYFQILADDRAAGIMRSFDLIFVDGDHRRKQVEKDVANALRVLSPSGVVVMHDCLPASAAAASPEKPANGLPWNGEAWKVYVGWSANPNVAAVANCDHGLGMLRKAAKQTKRTEQPPWEMVGFTRKHSYNIIEPTEVVQWIHSYPV